MTISIEHILFIAAFLILISIFSSKIATKLRVPALLIFILVGMLAGSEGPGGIYFDNQWAAQLFGVIALSYIIFDGGLNSNWISIKQVFVPGLSLSSFGVVITTMIVGIFSYYVIGFSLVEGLLLGSIVSSTDAAAVFSVLKSSNTNLPGRLKRLLEFESGSNDPMAVILTICFVELIINPALSIWELAATFVLQVVIGVVSGLVMGRLIIVLINKLKLEYEGLYPVLTLTMVLFVYGGTAMLGGSGFLAVYIVGLMMGSSDFIHKKSLIKFHDGLGWLMQISMFLLLGLLVFPSNLVHVTGVGLLLSFFLIFVARPLSVFISLPVSGLNLKEKLFTSWVGLRGAVPIILATFPLLADVPKADLIFNLVFFIVLTSVLLQGSTIPVVSKFLGLHSDEEEDFRTVDVDLPYRTDSKMSEIIISENSPVIGKRIVDIDLPQDVLIVLINRKNGSIVPNGGTVIENKDKLLVLTHDEGLNYLRSIIK